MLGIVLPNVPDSKIKIVFGCQVLKCFYEIGYKPGRQVTVYAAMVLS